MAFLKVLEDGSHMIMMECPEAVNTLLHEFFLWEPATLPPPKKESKTRPETAKALSDNTKATSDPSKVRPATARQASSNGGTEKQAGSKDKKWLKVKAEASPGCHNISRLAMHFVGPDNLSWVFGCLTRRWDRRASLSETVQLKVGRVKVWRDAGNSGFPVMPAAELKDRGQRALMLEAGGPFFSLQLPLINIQQGRYSCALKWRVVMMSFKVEQEMETVTYSHEGEEDITFDFCGQIRKCHLPYWQFHF